MNNLHEISPDQNAFYTTDVIDSFAFGEGGKGTVRKSLQI